MGLRINNNINAINAARQLGYSNKALSSSLARLSSGYRINTGADDPAGLTISEKLRAQIVGLKQGVENSQDAINLVGTAEGALNEMNELLRSMRSLALDSANLGTVDQDQIDANQAEVDSAVNSINRISNTTKFGNKYLLNGTQSFDVSYNGAAATDLDDLQVYRAQLGSAASLQINYNISSGAEYAEYDTGIAAAAALSGDHVMQISGATGSEQITLASGALGSDVMDAINAVSDNTGVKGELSGATVRFRSTIWGSDALVQVEEITAVGDLGVGGKATGKDIIGSINGLKGVGNGLELSIDSSSFAGKLVFTADAGSLDGQADSFDVNDEGLLFQLGDRTNPNEQASVGINSMHSYNLGVAEGRLSAIKTGGDYDLSTDADTAVRIIDAAIDDVTGLRARLGAFQVNTLETNINSLGVAIENVTGSESRIRDVDFASEAAEFTKAQILVQAGTSVAAQANVASQSVLQLLS